MIQKLYFCERTNKEPINLLYNDVKNLTSILSFCIRPKYVSSNDDTKALFLCELHFSHIFYKSTILSFCIGPKCVF